MKPWLGDHYGNAHSIHEPGRRARAAVERARGQIASLLGCEPEEVFFTSGATEANNWVLRSFEGRRAAVSPFEHSSIREPALALGFDTLPNDGSELLPPGGGLDLASVMLVNNEVGSIFDPGSIHASVRHSDITQAVGKIRFHLDSLDLASFSGHKFYGPQGIGGLFAKSAETPEPLLRGGEQEDGARAGTLNVAGIVGVGTAAAIAIDEQEQDYQLAVTLGQIVQSELSSVPDWQINGGADRSPFILSLSFLGLEGESLVIDLDRAGFAISSGAACSSRSTEPSHVLTALGLPPEWLRGTIRISFGRFNTKESARDLGSALAHAINNLRNLA